MEWSSTSLSTLAITSSDNPSLENYEKLCDEEPYDEFQQNFFCFLELITDNFNYNYKRTLKIEPTEIDICIYIYTHCY